MGVLRMVDDRKHFLPADTCARLWKVHTGEQEGDARDKAFVKRVKEWLLNPHTAPESWVTKHQEKIAARDHPYFQERLPYKEDEIERRQ